MGGIGDGPVFEFLLEIWRSGVYYQTDRAQIYRQKCIFHSLVISFDRFLLQVCISGFLCSWFFLKL
jgi:hypothetical protein